jgi:hypothetical protein
MIDKKLKEDNFFFKIQFFKQSQIKKNTNQKTMDKILRENKWNG